MNYLVILTSLLIPSVCCAQQLRVAIIDSGLDINDGRFKDHLCKSGHTNLVSHETLNDVNGHGTCVTSLVQEYAKGSDYCLLIYKFYGKTSSYSETVKREVTAIQLAINNHANIINLSAGGATYSRQEHILIQKNPNITFVVASGNDGLDLDAGNNRFYPASLNESNIIAVGANRATEEIAKFSNYGSTVKNYEVGDRVSCAAIGKGNRYLSGTSLSAAIFSGKLINKRGVK
jgi:hypothetical protein